MKFLNKMFTKRKSFDSSENSSDRTTTEKYKKLLSFLVSLDPRIKPLIMVIKYWAKVCGVTGTHMRLTTYSLVMLVIFYLQQLEPPLLPAVAQLQQLSQHKQYSLGWECSFCDEEWRVQSECFSQHNNLSLRELLTGFFRFYNSFDFNNVICPLLATSLPVKDFESDDGSDLPEEMFLYKEKLKSDPKCKFRTNVNLRLQDPFELCLNITRNVVERSFFVFKEACKASLKLCEKESDVTLLTSLFSIDPESLDVSDNHLKLNIPFKDETSDPAEASDIALEQWYELTTNAMMLVLRQILKFNVDPQSSEVLNKVKKLESSQDVHTPMNNSNGDKSVFVCCGKSCVWNSRRKMSRFMNSMKITLNAFEREVCISNALYCPDDKVSFSFTIAMSTLQDFKKGGKGIEVHVNIKRCQSPLVKGFIQFMKYDFRVFVLKAADFINKVSSSSPSTDVKESLKELFELKFENLPDLKELMKNKNRIFSGKEQDGKVVQKPKDDKVVEKQNVLIDSGLGNVDKEAKPPPCFNGTDETRSPEPKCSKQLSLIEGKPTSENAAENEAKKCILSPDDVPSSETQILINECFMPTSPNQINVSKNSDTNVENSEIDQLNNLLNSIKKIETQSTFASDKVNPFLASIEKVAHKSLIIESESETGDNTEVESVEGDGKCIGNEEVTNTSNDEKDTQEKMDMKSEGNEVCEKCDSVEDKNIKKGEILPSLILTKSNEKHDVEKQASMDKVINEVRIDTKLSLQRPKIHSERPSKQRKPNRFNKKVPQQNQPWAGGGPPGCLPWSRQPQPATPQHHDDNHGNNHRGSRKHSSNSSIEMQKKCYPGLFKDDEYQKN